MSDEELQDVILSDGVPRECIRCGLRLVPRPAPATLGFEFS